MANIKSSKKDIIRSRGRRLRNLAWKSRLKTAVRKSRMATDAGDAVVSVELCRQACRLLDKAAQKGVIHRRQAARRKSRLAKRLVRLSAAGEG